MSNCAYVSVWLREWSAETMLGQWGKLLTTVPFAEGREGFTELIVRAVGPAETALAEFDMTGIAAEPERIVELGAEFAAGDLGDAEIQTKALWDVWVYDPAVGRCRSQAEPVKICCRGEAYDDGVFAERGHFEIDAGFEHLFTGHAQLLGRGENGGGGVSEHPLEAEFLARMKEPELRRDYEAKTRENIRKLFDWMKRVEETIDVERYRLWSEGEENFEARVDEILALQ